MNGQQWSYNATVNRVSRYRVFVTRCTDSRAYYFGIANAERFDPTADKFPFEVASVDGAARQTARAPTLRARNIAVGLSV